ncbi:MAG TPA: formimidoylglutamate deiminase [Myxococcales bacterium]|nr:formimidoylglutamate deiminase [Myxococcales bacterium]
MSARRWLQPELLFWEGRVRSGLALEVDEQGCVASAGVPPPGAAVEPLRGRLLLPGLVNAHSHAFQRLIRGRTEYAAAGQGRDDFWSWRELMYRAANALDPEGVYVASRQAFVEMALGGATAVGEFHYLHHAPDGAPYADRLELARQVVRAARDAGLRICLLRVGYARAGFHRPQNPGQRRFIDPTVDRFVSDAVALREAMRGDPRVVVGLAPHSVRAVPRPWLEQLSRAAPRDMPVHLHAAEQPAEVAACREEHGRAPVEQLDEVGLLREGVTLVHAVHLEDGEVKRAGASGATVCACPSTERNLGDGVVRADELLRAGSPVCLGTDSHAAVDLLDEARQLEGHLRLWRLRRAVLDPGTGEPDGLAVRLLACATKRGAWSLGLEGTGWLEPRQAADLFTVDLEHPALAGCSEESVLPALLLGGAPGAVRDVAVGGEWIVRDGAHPLQRESARAFAELSRRVFA